MLPYKSSTGASPASLRKRCPNLLLYLRPATKFFFVVHLSSETLLASCSATSTTEDWIRDALQLRPNPKYPTRSFEDVLDHVIKAADSVGQAVSWVTNKARASPRLELVLAALQSPSGSAYLKLLDPANAVMDDIKELLDLGGRAILKKVLSPEQYEYWGPLLKAVPIAFDVTVFVVMLFIPGTGEVGAAEISMERGLAKGLSEELEEGALQAADQAAKKNILRRIKSIFMPKTRIASPGPLEIIQDTFALADESTTQKLIPAAEAAGKAQKAFEAFEKEINLLELAGETESERADQLALEAFEADSVANKLAMDVKKSIKPQTGKTQLTKPGESFQKALYEAVRKSKSSKLKPCIQLSKGAEGAIPLDNVYATAERMRGIETGADATLNGVARYLEQMQIRYRKALVGSHLATEFPTLWEETIDAVWKARSGERQLLNSVVRLANLLNSESATARELEEAMDDAVSSSRKFCEQTDVASSLRQQLLETESPDVWQELKQECNAKIKIAGRALSPQEVQELTRTTSAAVQRLRQQAEELAQAEIPIEAPVRGAQSPAWQPKESLIDYLNGIDEFKSASRAFRLQEAEAIAEVQAEAKTMWNSAAEAFRRDPGLETFCGMMKEIQPVVRAELRLIQEGNSARLRLDEDFVPHPEEQVSEWRIDPSAPDMMIWADGKINLRLSNLKAILRDRVHQQEMGSTFEVRWFPDSETLVEERLDELMHPEPKLDGLKRTVRKYPTMGEDQLIQELVKLPSATTLDIRHLVEATDRAAESWQKCQCLLLKDEGMIQSATQPVSKVDLMLYRHRQRLIRSQLKLSSDAEKEITVLLERIRKNHPPEQSSASSASSATSALSPADARDLVNEFQADRLSEVLGRMEAELPESAMKRQIACSEQVIPESLSSKQLQHVQRLARLKMEALQARELRPELEQFSFGELGLGDEKNMWKVFYRDYYGNKGQETLAAKNRQRMQDFLRPQLQSEALLQQIRQDRALNELVRRAQLDPVSFCEDIFPEDVARFVTHSSFPADFFSDWLPSASATDFKNIFHHLPYEARCLLRDAAAAQEEFRFQLTKFEDLLKSKARGRRAQAKQLTSAWKTAAVKRNELESLIGRDTMQIVQQAAKDTDIQSFVLPGDDPVSVENLPTMMELNEEVAKTLERYYWRTMFVRTLKAVFIPSLISVMKESMPAEEPTASVPQLKIEARPGEPLLQAVQALHEYQRTSKGFLSLINCLSRKRKASLEELQILQELICNLPEIVDAVEDADLKASTAAVLAARTNSAYLDYLVAQAYGEFPSTFAFENGVTATVEDILTIDNLAKVYSNPTDNESNILNDSAFEVNTWPNELLNIVSDFCASNSSLLAERNGSLHLAFCDGSGLTSQFAQHSVSGVRYNVTVSRNGTLARATPARALSAEEMRAHLHKVLRAHVPDN